MKIVDRKTFLAMPSGTLFSKYTPSVFGDLCISGGRCGENDFLAQPIADAINYTGDSFNLFDKLDAAQRDGVSLDMDFDCYGRDGLYDADQLFAVWERQDVEALIAVLQATLNSKD